MLLQSPLCCAEDPKLPRPAVQLEEPEERIAELPGFVPALAVAPGFCAPKLPRPADQLDTPAPLGNALAAAAGEPVAELEGEGLTLPVRHTPLSGLAFCCVCAYAALTKSPAARTTLVMANLRREQVMVWILLKQAISRWFLRLPRYNAPIRRERAPMTTWHGHIVAHSLRLVASHPAGMHELHL